MMLECADEPVSGSGGRGGSTLTCGGNGGGRGGSTLASGGKGGSTLDSGSVGGELSTCFLARGDGVSCGRRSCSAGVSSTSPTVGCCGTADGLDASGNIGRIAQSNPWMPKEPKTARVIGWRRVLGILVE